MLVPMFISAMALAVGDPCNPTIPGNMPDLDQVRRAAMFVDGFPAEGLPNDGYAYCVPTSTLNIFLYLANNGYPSLPPGPGGYLGGGTPQYNTYRNYLNSLGIAMSTDEDGGTNYGDWATATNGIIENAGLTGSILTGSLYTTSDDAPTLGQIGFSLLLEWPTAVCVGWYTPDAGVYTRNNGHCFVARSVNGLCVPANRGISIRDPATDNTLTNPPGDAFRQSPPSTETYATQTQSHSFQLHTTNYNGPLEFMQGYSFDGSLAYIDGVRVFVPAFGLTPCCDGLAVGVNTPGPSGGPSSTTRFALPPNRAILDAAISPLKHRFFAVVDRTSTGAPTTLWEVNRATGEAVQRTFPVPPLRVATGREESHLYILREDCLIYTTIGTDVHTITPPAPVMAICFDHAQNQIVALSVSARRVFRFNATSRALVSNQLLPSSLPLGPNPRISICPVGAYLWLASGLNRIDGLNGTGAALSTAATISEPDLIATGVDTDDRGHVFTSSGGNIREYAPPSVPTGSWTRATISKWDGMPVEGAFFQIARSTTNFTPGLHDAAPWSTQTLPNTFAASVLDCAADFNFSGTVTVADIFAMLAAWFSHQPRADWNQNGQWTVSDIFAFLATWFAGCQ